MNLPLFLVPLLAGLIAQALKPLLNRHFYVKFRPRGHLVPRYGGMPSAHSAFVFSLATIIGLVDGIGSTTFAVAAAAVILILDDALRLRIFLAHYGQALALLIRRLPSGDGGKFPYVETQLGHKPLEALAGACLGMGVSFLFYFLTII